MMLLLVQIDLSKADLCAFDAYEAAVLERLPPYGGCLLERVRTLDAAAETHLLSFPDREAFQAYLADPVRLSLGEAWSVIGARTLIQEVHRPGSGAAWPDGGRDHEF